MHCRLLCLDPVNHGDLSNLTPAQQLFQLLVSIAFRIYYEIPAFWSEHCSVTLFSTVHALCSRSGRQQKQVLTITFMNFMTSSSRVTTALTSCTAPAASTRPDSSHSSRIAALS